MANSILSFSHFFLLLEPEIEKNGSITTTNNECRAWIASTYISKQCVFCLSNTSESVKYKFWDCIQARCVWQWATFIMHELCKVGKQVLFGERIPIKFARNIKIWHSLWGITLWTIWIEWNDRMFYHEQWHQSKMRHLIMCSKVAWARVVKFVKINAYLAEALLKGFDQTLGRTLIHVFNNPSATEGYLSWDYLSKKLEFFTPYQYR